MPVNRQQPLQTQQQQGVSPNTFYDMTAANIAGQLQQLLNSGVQTASGVLNTQAGMLERQNNFYEAADKLQKAGYDSGIALGQYKMENIKRLNDIASSDTSADIQNTNFNLQKLLNQRTQDILSIVNNSTPDQIKQLASGPFGQAMDPMAYLQTEQLLGDRAAHQDFGAVAQQIAINPNKNPMEFISQAPGLGSLATPRARAAYTARITGDVVNYQQSAMINYTLQQRQNAVATIGQDFVADTLNAFGNNKFTPDAFKLYVAAADKRFWDMNPITANKENSFAFTSGLINQLVSSGSVAALEPDQSQALIDGISAIVKDDPRYKPILDNATVSVRNQQLAIQGSILSQMKERLNNAISDPKSPLDAYNLLKGAAIDLITPPTDAQRNPVMGADNRPKQAKLTDPFSGELYRALKDVLPNINTNEAIIQESHGKSSSGSPTNPLQNQIQGNPGILPPTPIPRTPENMANVDSRMNILAAQNGWSLPQTIVQTLKTRGWVTDSQLANLATMTAVPWTKDNANDPNIALKWNTAGEILKGMYVTNPAATRQMVSDGKIPTRLGLIGAIMDGAPKGNTYISLAQQVGGLTDNEIATAKMFMSNGMNVSASDFAGVKNPDQVKQVEAAMGSISGSVDNSINRGWLSSTNPNLLSLGPHMTFSSDYPSQKANLAYRAIFSLGLAEALKSQKDLPIAIQESKQNAQNVIMENWDTLDLGLQNAIKPTFGLGGKYRYVVSSDAPIFQGMDPSGNIVPLSGAKGVATSLSEPKGQAAHIMDIIVSGELKRDYIDLVKSKVIPDNNILPLTGFPRNVVPYLPPFFINNTLPTDMLSLDMDNSGTPRYDANTNIYWWDIPKKLNDKLLQQSQFGTSDQDKSRAAIHFPLSWTPEGMKYQKVLLDHYQENSPTSHGSPKTRVSGRNVLLE